MSDNDLECINWQRFGDDDVVDNDDDDDDDDGGTEYDFVVKKNDEQKENFELFSGFDVCIF